MTRESLLRSPAPPPVVCAEPALRGSAASLAERLGAALLETASADAPALLSVTADGLALLPAAIPGAGPVSVELRTLDRLCDRPSRDQPLARAVGLRSGRPAPVVLDATAGLLGDAVLLAALGCRVVACERSPVIAAMIADALARADAAADARRLAAVLRDRLRFVHADARSLLEMSARDRWRGWFGVDGPDVVFIDPMHPPRRKAALVKKEMRAVRLVVGDDPDSADVLRRALALGADRVVVKLPRAAPPLIDTPPPTAAHRGRAIRYDVYSGRW